MALLRIDGPSDGVATLALDRPDKRNALSTALRDEISDALDALADDQDLRCVVITGVGEVFSAGFDLSEFQVDDAAFQEALWASSDRYHRTVLTFPLPVIAAVNGPAIAGGFDLAVMADIRLASSTATFSHPEIRFGDVVYGPLHDLVGAAVARDLAFTGRPIDAAEAVEDRRVDLALDEAPEAVRGRAVDRATDAVRHARTKPDGEEDRRRALPLRRRVAEHPQGADLRDGIDEVVENGRGLALVDVEIEEVDPARADRRLDVEVRAETTNGGRSERVGEPRASLDLKPVNRHRAELARRAVDCQLLTMTIRGRPPHTECSRRRAAASASTMICQRGPSMAHARRKSRASPLTGKGPPRTIDDTVVGWSPAKPERGRRREHLRRAQTIRYLARFIRERSGRAGRGRLDPVPKRDLCRGHPEAPGHRDPR
ncbi:MAG: enoyl-CoA hydratase/isomerase family protein [Myxococcales bacterium]|nr:enoyl-CoA hydratase/isomerase family protein [Myxococcales bacterium]